MHIPLIYVRYFMVAFINVHSSFSTPQLATRGNSKGRRRRRGGASNADPSTDANTSNEDGTAVRGRGRGSWRGKRGNISKHTPPSESRLTQRASRFKDHLVQSPIGSGSIGRTTSQLLSNYTDERDDLAVDFGSCQIIGTMQEIEKQYLRLTRVSFVSTIDCVKYIPQCFFSYPLVINFIFYQLSVKKIYNFL